MSSIDETLQERGISTSRYGLPTEKLKLPEHWLTKEEAVLLLNIWKEEYIQKHNLYYMPISRIRDYFFFRYNVISLLRYYVIMVIPAVSSMHICVK